MQLIDPNEIRFVLTPIAPVLSGGLVHYERVAFQHEVSQIRKIEAEPVKHARWIEGNEDHVSCDSICYYTCSECNHSFSDDTPYCPNCGALMDEEIEGKSKK